LRKTYLQIYFFASEKYFKALQYTNDIVLLKVNAVQCKRFEL